MADLVSLDDFKEYIGYRKSDKDAVLQAILDAVEEHLEDETDQIFSAAGSVSNETLSGNGTAVLYLRRPASSLTSIKVSAISDVANPDYTIPTSEVRIDPTHAQRLIRVQNGVFPRGILNVFVSYEAAENLPKPAIEAVKDAAAMVWRGRGSEHVVSESLGDLGSQVLEVQQYFNRRPLWNAAVARLRGSVVAA